MSTISRWGTALALLCGLTACGGGGGASTADPQAQPLQIEKISTDEATAGMTALSAPLMPLSAGNRWVSDVLNESDLPSGVLETDQVVGLTGNVAAMRTARSDTPDEPDNYTYAVNGRVVSIRDLFGDTLLAKASPAVGDLQSYPGALPAQGLVQRSIRQGDLGQDLDGDTLDDGYRLSYAQFLEGRQTQTIRVLGVSREVIHLRTIVRLSVFISSEKGREVPLQDIVVDEYLVAGLGPIRREATQRDLIDNTELREVTVLKSATVDGQTLGPDLRTTAVATTAVSGVSQLQWMPGRQWFVGLIDRDGHTQAVAIDPVTGAEMARTTLTKGLLRQLRVAPSGELMYLFDPNTSTVLRVEAQGAKAPFALALTGELQLPVPDFLTGLPDTTRFYPEDLAISPADPNRVLIGAHTNAAVFNPQEGSVVFTVDDMAITRRQNGMWAVRLIFDTTGNRLIAHLRGLDIGNNEQQLTALRLQADGVLSIVTQASPTDNMALPTPDHDIRGDVLYGLSRTIHFDTLAGEAWTSRCRLLPGSQSARVCPGGNRLTGLDIQAAGDGQTTFVLAYPDLPTMVYDMAITTGPSGIVAVGQSGSGSLYLMASPQLQLP
jgi:hypothetical protein